MTERAGNPGENSPEEWSETTARAYFEVSSRPIGKLEAAVSGPPKTVTDIVQAVTGIILTLGAGVTLWVGTQTEYAGWFIALAALMAVLGTTLTLRRRS